MTNLRAILNCVAGEERKWKLVLAVIWTDRRMERHTGCLKKSGISDMLRFHENPPFEIKLKTGAVAFS